MVIKEKESEKTKTGKKIILGDYRVIPVTMLESCLVREIRPDNVERIKQSIEEKGFNPSRVLTVVPNGENYLVAAGNHRLLAVKELGMKAIPCLVIEDDIYSIAVRDNQDEETFAKLDLFDWWDIIKKLKEDFTHEEIGNIIGWSEAKVNQYSALINNILTPILNLAKEHQLGRVSDNLTIVSFDFSEGWFRTSGLYALNEKYQLNCIERFIADKCRWSKTLLQSETKKYQRWQEFIEIAREKLLDNTNLEKILPLIENDTFKNEGQLLDKINDFNKDSKNKLICGDALIELLKLEDNLIDLVIIDPPYGNNYSSNFSLDNDYMSKKPIKNDGLEEALSLLDNSLKILNDKTKTNSHFYIFTSWKVYPQFSEIISRYLTIKNVIVWWKKVGYPLGDLKHTWANQYDLIIFATKGKRPINKRKHDVIEVNKITCNRDKIHPTQKPVELIKKLLEVSLQTGDTVCDCFMGSGSTIKAVIETDPNCNYIGIELDKGFFEKAKVFISGGSLVE